MDPRALRAARCQPSPRVTLAGLLLGLAVNTACQQEHVSPSRTASSPRAAQRTAASIAERPNIVVIMTDDQTLESMRVMPQTLDRIGSAGVIFDNYVVTYATCCPSRATLLTGQYPHNHGVRSNADPDGGYARLDHGNTLPLWLQAAGYVTAWIGKYLNGYGRVNQLEIPPGWNEWYASVGNTDSKYFNYMLNENGRVMSYDRTESNYKTDVFTRKAVDFINRRAPNDAAVAPFFLFVSYFAPHGGGPVEPGDPTIVGTPFPAPRHKGRFAGERLPLFPSFNEADMSDKPFSMRGRALLSATGVSQLHEAHRQRLESLLAVDEGVGQIVEALREEGVLENTLIIFTSDNGWFQGQHRIKSGKVWPYEPAVKVPLLIRGPGIQPGRRIPAPVANIDLVPTLVQASGATARRTMDGRSLFPFLSGGQTNWITGNGPRHVLVEDSQLGKEQSVFWSIRRGIYVYTEYANGDRELYNLRVDPDQLTSRHADRTLGPVRRQLATRLAVMKSCVGPIACW